MGLQIQLLGLFRVLRDGEDITAEIHKIGKVDVLLKLLLSQPGQTFTTDQLVEALWSEELDEGKTEVERATANLHRRISELRKLLEPCLKKASQSLYILKRPRGYCFNPQTECRIDAQDSIQYYEQAQVLQDQEQFEQAVAAYEAALKLVHGEYLAEDRYGGWAIPLRQKWQEAYLNLLERLADCYARLGQYRRAIARCQEVLRKEKYRESIYRQLMLYYYLAGYQGEALRTYEQCQQAMAELDIQPASATQDLQQQILQRHVPEIDQLYPPPRVVRREIPYTLSPGSIPFVGRQSEYAHLVGHLEQARKGRGCCVLISGEAGVGKTRLVQELIAYARKRFKTHVFQGICHELGLQLSYQPWAEAIRGELPRLKREDFRLVLPVWLAEVAKLVAELRVRMPELPENPPLPPQQEQLRLFEGLVQFFLGMVEPKSAPRPLVLFLDDFHLADGASLDLLSHLLLRIEKRPVLILGTYRVEEVGEGHPVLKLVQTWEPRNLLHVLSLSRLAGQEVEELLNKLPLAVKRPNLFCQRLYEETEGNPLFLIATLQHFIEEGALQVKSGRWVTDIEDISANYRELMIPPTVKDLIQRRLSWLSRSEVKLLQLASAIGRDFEFPVLEKAWEGNGESLMTLEVLVKAQLVVEQQHRYAFSHDKIREVVYEQMSLPRQQRMHRRVVQALEKVHAGQVGNWGTLLAQHAHRAGEWKKALGYALKAIKKAVKEYRHQEVLELAELGLEEVEKLETAGEDRVYINVQQFELLAQRVEIYDLLGLRKEQEKDLDQLQQLCGQLQDKGKQALVYQKRGDLHFNIGRYSEAEEATRKALGIYQEIGDQQGQGLSLNKIGNVFHYLGRYEEALSYLQQALEIFKEIGDQRGQGFILNNIGNVFDALGRYEEALSYRQQALEILKEIGDRRGQGLTLGSIGNVFWGLGRYEEALRYFQHAWDVLREIGDQQGQGAGLHNMGNAFEALGQYDEALRYRHKALDIFKEIGNRLGEGYSLHNIGLVYFELGQYEEALRYFQHGLEILQELGEQLGQGYCLHSIGKALHKLGQHTEALRYQDQARSIFEELGVKTEQPTCLSAEGMAHLGLTRREQALTCSSQAIQLLEGGHICEKPQEVYFNHFRILTAHGQDSEATTYLQKAHDAVMQRAQQIKDPEARESFLKNVKINREILEVWEKQLPGEWSP